MNCLNIIENYYSDSINEIAFLHKNVDSFSFLVKKYNENIITHSYDMLFEEVRTRSKLMRRLSLVLSVLHGRITVGNIENKNQIYDSLFIPWKLPLSYENTTSFLEICNRICDENEVLLKNHPRVKPVYESNSFIVDDSGNTFESVLFNIEIENKVLVSMCSTSCLTPFILKGKHPYVIFLGMLNTDEYNATFTSLYFQNVITNYESNKIFLPRNNKELEEIIKYCLNK